MKATLNVVTKIVAFGDEKINSNPRLRYVDWLRDISGTAVGDPKSEGHQILPGTSLTVFSGARTTTIDGTTVFSLSLLPIEGASRYRFTATSGTAPGFRTNRAIAASGVQLTFTTAANATQRLQSAAPLFAAVQVGDEVFIPHTTTGDSANVISVLNAGYWVVLSVASTSDITLVRQAGKDFEGVSETVTPASNSQLRIYSIAGVQVDDSMDVSLSFASAVLKTFTVAAVTDVFVEVVSTDPLPNQTGIQPTNAGMQFYSETKDFVYIETSQEIVVRVNGDIGNYQRVTPVDSSDPLKPGVYMRRGPTWSLSLYNRSAVPADVTVIHAE